MGVVPAVAYAAHADAKAHRIECRPVFLAGVLRALAEWKMVCVVGELKGPNQRGQARFFFVQQK